MFARGKDRSAGICTFSEHQPDRIFVVAVVASPITRRASSRELGVFVEFGPGLFTPCISSLTFLRFRKGIVEKG